VTDDDYVVPDSTCTSPTLGDNVINLFGLKIEGADPQGDKFYIGSKCF
jgi:hypothetical protein